MQKKKKDINKGVIESKIISQVVALFFDHFKVRNVAISILPLCPCWEKIIFLSFDFT